MERQHWQATRLLGGIGLLLLGALCLFVGAVSTACIGDGGIPPMCTSVVADPVALALFSVSGLALAAGAWRCWTALG